VLIFYREVREQEIRGGQGAGRTRWWRRRTSAEWKGVVENMG